MTTKTPANGIHNLTAANMANFFGTEQYYFNPLFRSINYTEGVKFLNANGAGWLVDKILANLIANPKLKGQEFVCIEFVVSNKSGQVRFSDGDENVLINEAITYTDFPLPEIKFFYTGGILLLASEY
jgi:hypothetical protein